MAGGAPRPPSSGLLALPSAVLGTVAHAGGSASALRGACRALRDAWDPSVVSLELTGDPAAAPENLLLRRQWAAKDPPAGMALRKELLGGLLRRLQGPRRLALRPSGLRLLPARPRAAASTASNEVWSWLLPLLLAEGGVEGAAAVAARLTSLSLAGQLIGSGSSSGGAHLLALGSMTSLTELDLSRTLGRTCPPGRYPRILGACPPGLRSLDLTGNPELPLDELAAPLGLLGGLRSLDLSGRLKSPLPLAEALRQLTGLTRLRISKVNMEMGNMSQPWRGGPWVYTAPETTGRQLVAAIGSLAGLRDLAVSTSGVLTHMEPALVSLAGSLTSLELGISSSGRLDTVTTVPAMLRAVTGIHGLQQLTLFGGGDWTHYLLQGIWVLSQLTALHLLSPYDTSGGRLSPLLGLRELSLVSAYMVRDFFDFGESRLASLSGLTSLRLHSMPPSSPHWLPLHHSRLSLEAQQVQFLRPLFDAS